MDSTATGPLPDTITRRDLFRAPRVVHAPPPNLLGSDRASVLWQDLLPTLGVSTEHGALQ